MSTISPPPASGVSASKDDQYNCNWCEAKYEPRLEYKAGFCSRTCFGAHLAENVLNQLDHDHRFCTQCFSKIRSVYPPSRDGHSSDVQRDEEGNPVRFERSIPDCAIGRAYPAPDCEFTHYAAPRTPRDPTWDDWTYEPDDDEYTSRAHCSCGCLHHSTADPDLRAGRFVGNPGGGDYYRQLAVAATMLELEDKTNHRVDPNVLREELSDAYLHLNADQQHDRIAVALGQAILALKE